MYGIIVPPDTTPYVISDTEENLWPLLAANYRRGHASQYVVERDPECAMCDGAVPGWFEVDENGDYPEPPLHDRCRNDHADMQWADIYV